MIIRPYLPQDVPAMTAIWNEVVTTGRAFPQVDTLGEDAAAEFFAAQTRTAVAVDGEDVLGLYILHPNDIGRKAHIANASYAVRKDARGRGVGRALVTDSLTQLAPCGFRGMQFNAVVVSNTAAIKLYESLGMRRVGTIPGGFESVDGFQDMHIYFYEVLPQSEENTQTGQK